MVGLCLFHESFEVDDQGAAFWGSCQRRWARGMGSGRGRHGSLVLCTRTLQQRGSVCPASFITTPHSGCLKQRILCHQACLPRTHTIRTHMVI